MPLTHNRTITRTTAINRLLAYRLESWDADDTKKVIREGREGLREMSNLTLAELCEGWLDHPTTVTGTEPPASHRIDHSVLEALVTALTDLTAAVSMPGPHGTTAYIISDEQMQAAKAALALRHTTRSTQSRTHAT